MSSTVEDESMIERLVIINNEHNHFYLIEGLIFDLNEANSCLESILIKSTFI